MALKTVYLYPDPGALEWENVSNPGAALIDNGDASFATMFGSTSGQALLSAPTFNGDIPAGVRIESVGFQIRLRGWAPLLNVSSTAGAFYLTLHPSLDDWRVVGGEVRQDPFTYLLWEHVHPIELWTSIILMSEGEVDISYIRLAVTYDDGEPEPEPGPDPEPKPEEPEVPPLLIPRTVEAKLDPVGDGSALEPQAQTDLIPSTGEAELFRYQDPNPNQDTFLIPLGVGGKIV